MHVQSMSIDDIIASSALKCFGGLSIQLASNISYEQGFQPAGVPDQHSFIAIL